MQTWQHATFKYELHDLGHPVSVNLKSLLSERDEGKCYLAVALSAPTLVTTQMQTSHRDYSSLSSQTQETGTHYNIDLLSIVLLTKL